MDLAEVGDFIIQVLQFRFLVQKSSDVEKPPKVGDFSKTTIFSYWFERFPLYFSMTVIPLTSHNEDSPTDEAKELSQDKEFRSQMEELFSGAPSGCIVFYDLSWAVSKIRELENEIKLLKKEI